MRGTDFLYLNSWLNICQLYNMSRLKYSIIIVLFSVTSFSLLAQDAEKTEIAKAIQAGNSQAIGNYFAQSVDLTLNDLEDVYSKDQAVVILKKFFEENQPESFEVKHQGKSKLEDHFYIGDLKTNQQTYRLTFFLKKEGDSFKLKQLRIEQ